MISKDYCSFLINRLFENVYLEEEERDKQKNKNLRERYGLNPVNEDYYKTIRIYNDTNSK